MRNLVIIGTKLNEILRCPLGSQFDGVFLVLNVFKFPQFPEMYPFQKLSFD